VQGPPWRWCWGRKGPGRRPKPRHIWFRPPRVVFIPFTHHGERIEAEPVHIRPDELEALRLVYLEGLTQEEAAKRMNISRGTLWRALASGRRKIVEALVNIRPIVIESGEPGSIENNQQNPNP